MTRKRLAALACKANKLFNAYLLLVRVVDDAADADHVSFPMSHGITTLGVRFYIARTGGDGFPAVEEKYVFGS
jgi:hypothetical protein